MTGPCSFAAESTLAREPTSTRVLSCLRQWLHFALIFALAMSVIGDTAGSEYMGQTLRPEGQATASPENFPLYRQLWAVSCVYA